MHSLLRNKGRIDSLGATATMAQLVEQRIRNAWVAGSSPASGSLSWYPLGTSFFCITESRLRPLERPQGPWNVTIRTIAYCRVGKKAVPLQPIYKPY